MSARTHDPAPTDSSTLTGAPCARVQAEVSAVGATTLVLLMSVFGVEMAVVHYVAHAAAPGHVPAPPTWQWYALAVASLLVLKVVAHEAGHVLAGTPRGLTWVGWGIRASGTAYVRVGGRARTNTDQLLVSLGGPAADLVYATILFAANAALGLPDWSPITVAAWMAVANGILGAGVPLKRSSDAARVYRCGWATATGRGRDQYRGY